MNPTPRKVGLFSIVALACCAPPHGVGAEPQSSGRPTGGKVTVREAPLTYPLNDLRHHMLVSARPGANLQPADRTRTEPSVELANEYLRVTVLPAHAGVIESAQFKPTGCEFFSREKRFRYLWPYWESGVKLSFPFHEHGGCLIDQPASYRIVRGEDGSATVAMWMEFSRWNYDADAVAWRRHKQTGEKREPCLLPPKDATPKNMYSNLLVSQHVTLKPAEATFSVTYRLVNPSPFRVGRKIWNDTFLPRIHTTTGEVHGVTPPPPGRQTTELVLPAVHVSNHGGRDFRVWDRAEMALDKSPKPWNTLFAWHVPYGFAGLWYPDVKVNRLRLTDPDVAPGTKIYFRGYNPKFDPNVPQANIYNSLELWGGTDNIFEGTENWIEPGQAWQFTHRFALICGIGKVDYADDGLAVSVAFGGEAPVVEVVTLRPVQALTAERDGKPLGKPQPCSPDKPARFALPRGADTARITLRAAGKVLLDRTFPLALKANTTRYDAIRASLDGRCENIEKANCGTGYGRALYRTALRKYPYGTVGRGRVLYRDGQLGAAVECLGQATQRDGDDGEGWHLLGAALLERGEASGAGQAFNKAVRAARPYAPARYFLAVLQLASGRADRAQKELVELVKARPDHWEARLLKAWVGAQADTGRQAALAEARTLAAEDPADPRASRVLVECLDKAGLDEQAAAEQKACRALLAEPGAQRRVEEFLAATRGRYLPTRRIGRLSK